MITDKKFILDLIEKHLNLKQIWSVGVCKIQYMGKTQNILLKNRQTTQIAIFTLNTEETFIFSFWFASTTFVLFLFAYSKLERKTHVAFSNPERKLMYLPFLHEKLAFE